MTSHPCAAQYNTSFLVTEQLQLKFGVWCLAYRHLNHIVGGIIHSLFPKDCFPFILLKWTAPWCEYGALYSSHPAKPLIES